VARALRARHGERIKLIALTGWGQEGDRRRALEAGFDYHLTKPVDPAVLNELLAGAESAA
jgi:CheY-like chemotaxis protein